MRCVCCGQRLGAGLRGVIARPENSRPGHLRLACGGHAAGMRLAGGWQAAGRRIGAAPLRVRLPGLVGCPAVEGVALANHEREPAVCDQIPDTRMLLDDRLNRSTRRFDQHQQP